jgi:hypothetical protein
MAFCKWITSIWPTHLVVVILKMEDVIGENYCYQLLGDFLFNYVIHLVRRSSVFLVTTSVLITLF